ncbi:hypothetical protein [Aliiglaciecola sp. NS0011-25]|uniref:hypothetical protein n=1 Tax=Aliiglaciecola sp. NS0011-25 TaxID=3127654 RepID=UPI0031083C89
MGSGRRIGYIKFFRDLDKLKSFEDGLFYCNTPEFYRQSPADGVSDPHESCFHAYRKSRGDDSVKIQINGTEIEGITDSTTYLGGLKDRWLHCWFAFDMPESDIEFDNLYQNIQMMRKEFGENFAFLPRENLLRFVNRLRSAIELNLEHGNVKYSSNKQEWSFACKSSAYSYQKEFRFVVGECGHLETTPLKIIVQEGFSDLIFVNDSIELKDKNSNLLFFYLDKNNCLGIKSS